jgi:mono/diheme cytochrome c family protein
MSTFERPGAGRIALAAALIAAATGTRAADPDIEAGRRFAEANCSRCHAIGPTGASPLAEAPPFRTFVRKWPLENLEEALAEGIVVGHDAMPEFELSPRQIADLIGYLGTLGRR